MRIDIMTSWFNRSNLVLPFFFSLKQTQQRDGFDSSEHWSPLSSPLFDFGVPAMAEVLEKVPYLHKKFECASDCCAQHHIFSRFTLWQSKIDMENVPFIDDLAFTICLQWSFSIATCRITRGSSSSFRESSRHFRFLPRYSKMA